MGFFILSWESMGGNGRNEDKIDRSELTWHEINP